MNKNRFLLIETSTEACSVALAENDRILAKRWTNEPKAHARLLAPFVTEVLAEHNLSLKDCQAIAVSQGPGSYTGLRVGVSTAKGLCYGAGLPLLGIGTLDLLAEAARLHLQAQGISAQRLLIIPMVDARRMEVYAARYNADAQALTEPLPVILDEHSFEEEFQAYDRLVFIGDGVQKFRTILSEEKQSKASWFEECPDASTMLRPARVAYEKKEFKDVAYFEPFYLKDFVAGTSKKSLL
ncbi:MAG: tRNA (adenosine(37)-N6)-threonylcarbamoyltransferase complex dimerization subunit type 1 TsaB [Bacteroidales bacterium]|nr:tRNA (adenosine(37)-N6)-threonylcarbamoyltransferase complex dimerization subunit type 1 TsaB [Bacteroidales bacterium]